MGPILGALFAVLIGLLAVRPVISYQEAALHNVQSAATAGQMRQIATAAQAYIQANYAAVEANSTASSPATITVPMLESTGYLSPSTSPTNPFGQTWVVQVLQPSPGQLQALVLSTGGATIPEKQAPAIATQTGQEGGFVPYNGQYGSLSSAAAQGAYGHWSVALNGYTNPGPGHLAALLAFNNGNLENDYLYRVAVPGQPQLNTMQTALNMGNNNITAANNVSAQSAQLAAGTPNGMPGSLQIGSNYFYGDSTNAAVRTPGGLFIQNQSGTGPAPINEVGTISAAGNIGAAGEPATSGYPAGWSGGVHTWDMYANGTIAVGTNGSQNGWLQNNGYGGVSDTFLVGSRLELGTAFGGANQGWGCNPNGEIAANANGSGQLMACVNGSWQAAGGTGFTQSYQMGVGNGTWYQNTGSGPMFLASACGATPFSSGYMENVTIHVMNPSGQQVSNSDGQVQEGGSDSNFSAAPSASAVVPAGYYFVVTGQNMNCSLMVTR